MNSGDWRHLYFFVAGLPWQGPFGLWWIYTAGYWGVGACFDVYMVNENLCGGKRMMGAGVRVEGVPPTVFRRGVEGMVLVRGDGGAG